MLIGIDGNEANQKIRVGSGVYAYNLLKQIYIQAQSSNLKAQIYLKDNPINELPSPTNYWDYKVIKPAKLWTQMGLPIHLWKEKVLGKAPDVFFTPSHYAPKFCPIPSVITIFDLAFIRFPEMFLKKDLWQLKNWTEYSVRQAKKIITISEFSKKEIVDYYKIDSDKVVVAYPGYDKKRFKIQMSKFKIDVIKKKYKIHGEYILFIGTLQPRKNLARLIEAFTTFTIQDRKAKPIQDRIKLVICGMITEGRGGWMQEEILNQTESNIILTGYVKDEDLPYLMAGAKALVLSSLYEGFGIPVLEAMASGVPVVVSNTSSLPEVVGGAGIMVDPYGVNSIANGIKEACYNEAKRKSMIEKGLIQVKKFSWEKSATKILDVLNLSSRAKRGDLY